VANEDEYCLNDTGTLWIGEGCPTNNNRKIPLYAIARVQRPSESSAALAEDYVPHEASANAGRRTPIAG
jgi:hypothetical protein